MSEKSPRFRSAAKNEANPAESLSKFNKIVNLTVVDDVIPTVRRRHGLVSRGREIKNCEAPKAEGDSRLRIDPNAGVVGTAVDEGVGHPSNDGFREFFHRASTQEVTP